MIILRGTGHQTFSGIVDGHWPTYLQIVGRAALLDGAKRLLGDRRYDHLRGKALGLLKRG